ncbi:hypothetical protein [Ezakiella coagulans]|nr:hypothetical protein [Ezakiella coagulans]
MIKDGVLSYDDINKIDADDLYEVYYANHIFNEKLKEEEGESIDG